jgi:hypothetical protein
LEKLQSQAQAQVAATGGALKRTREILKEFLPLVAMGDVVQPEKVIEASGRLVAKGENPADVAGVLADMPTTGGSPAVSQWLSAYTQHIQGVEKQVEEAHAIARHELITISISGLMHGVMDEHMQGGAAMPPPMASNPLDTPSDEASAPPNMLAAPQASLPTLH